MTYITNSMTSANPALDLYTAMASALSSAGYTLVDTQIISTRTHKVWKSAAANNSLGLDWYLDVAYTTTGAGSVWLGAFEGYSSPNGIRGPYQRSDGTLPETTYYSRYGATGFALETNWSHVANNVCMLNTQVTNYAYWISITTDRVIAMTSIAPSSMMYCGFYDANVPYANKVGSLLYPLISTTVNAPASASVNANINNLSSFPTSPSTANPLAFTRRPPSATLNSNTASWHANNSVENITYGYFDNGNSAGPNYGGSIGAPLGVIDVGGGIFFDAPRGGKLSIVQSWSGSGAGLGGASLCVGQLKDLCVFVGNAVIRGDTITISSATWVMSSLITNRCYGFKAV